MDAKGVIELVDDVQRIIATRDGVLSMLIVVLVFAWWFTRRSAAKSALKADRAAKQAREDEEKLETRLDAERKEAREIERKLMMARETNLVEQVSEFRARLSELEKRAAESDRQHALCQSQRLDDVRTNARLFALQDRKIMFYKHVLIEHGLLEAPSITLDEITEDSQRFGRHRKEQPEPSRILELPE